MVRNIDIYSRRERFWLWCLSVFGFFAVNAAFMYGVFFQPDEWLARSQIQLP